MSRYLGQHFLINKAAIQKIVTALDLHSGDTVIEIGPGTGALTIPLAEKCEKLGCKLIAIEKDKALAQQAQKLVNSNQKLEVIMGDALHVLPDLIINYYLPITHYKLVGNIPYYITGKLLRTIGELENKPALTVLTIQREVAERLCVQPPKMNLLAAATQIWAKPEILARLKPDDFNPPPEVDSAIIKLATRAQPLATRKEMGAYYKLIKICFKQPRKTVLNNLSTGLEKPKNEMLEILKKLGLTGEERPQNLSVELLIKLSQKLFTF